MEPAEGQLWRTRAGGEYNHNGGKPFRIGKLAQGYWQCECGAYRVGGWSDAFRNGGLEFVGWAPGYGPEAKPREMAADETGHHPVACLGCGAARMRGMYHCAACLPASEESQKRCQEWREGARNFPRAPKVKAEPVIAPIEADQTHADFAKFIDAAAARLLPGVPVKVPPEFRYGGLATAKAVPVIFGIDPGAPFPPAPSPKRYVSHNGRDWVEYDRLVDADPFESYPFQRTGTTTDLRSPGFAARHHAWVMNDLWNRHVAADAVRRFETDFDDGIHLRPRPPNQEPWVPSCDVDFDIPDA